jgi:DnaJ-class molecular chaperone
MNLHEACRILDINNDNDEDILETTLIRQYRKMSLVYHPDKNKSIDATQKFLQVRESYDFLGKYLGYTDEDYYTDEYENEGHYNGNTMFGSWNFIAYRDNILGFLDITLGDDIMKQIQCRLLDNFLHNEQIKDYLGTIDYSKLIKLHSHLLENKNKYNISDTVLTYIEMAINLHKNT